MPAILRNNSLVSVALCTYNGARFVRAQLDSVLRQTYSNLEVVTVDDASRDETVAIVREYAARDPRIRVYENPENIGFCRNFERAVSLCTGEFIAPCDQDDVWLDEKLEILLNNIGDKPMIYSDGDLCDALGDSFGIAVSDRMKLSEVNDPFGLVMTNLVSGHAMLFRRRLLEQALPFSPAFEFHDWWLAAVAAATGGIAYCDRRLVLYRQHARNITDFLGKKSTTVDQRVPGYKILELRKMGAKLNALCAIKGPHQRTFQELSRLWNARENQYISPRLMWFMRKHAERFYVHMTKPKNLDRRIRDFLAGIRLKRLTNARAYQDA